MFGKFLDFITSWATLSQIGICLLGAHPFIRYDTSSTIALAALTIICNMHWISQKFIPVILWHMKQLRFNKERKSDSVG